MQPAPELLLSMGSKVYCWEVGEHLFVQCHHLVKVSHRPYIRSAQRQILGKPRDTVNIKSPQMTHQVHFRGRSCGRKSSSSAK